MRAAKARSIRPFMRRQRQHRRASPAKRGGGSWSLRPIPAIRARRVAPPNRSFMLAAAFEVRRHRRCGHLFCVTAGLLMVFGIVGVLSMAPEQSVQDDPVWLTRDYMRLRSDTLYEGETLCATVHWPWLHSSARQGTDLATSTKIVLGGTYRPFTGLEHRPWP